MKIAVVGANGQLGRQVCRYATENDHKVVAIVRGSADVGILSDLEKIKVVRADCTSAEELKHALKKCKAVIVAIGVPNATLFGTIDLMYKAGPAISKAMRENEISRVVLLSSGGTRDDPNAPFFNFARPFLNAKNVSDYAFCEDHFAHNCNDLEWTFLKVREFNSFACTNEDWVVTMDDREIVPDCEPTISRTNVARQMVHILEKEESFKKYISIGIRIPKPERNVISIFKNVFTLNKTEEAEEEEMEAAAVESEMVEGEVTVTKATIEVDGDIDGTADISLSIK